GKTRMAYSPDGHTAAMADERGRIDIWDVPAGKLRRTLRASGPAVGKLAFTPDGKTLAVGQTTGAIQLFDAASGKSGKTFFSNVKNVWIYAFTLMFSPDGRFLCVGDYPQAMQIWDIASGEVIWRGQCGFGSVFSADGKTLFVTKIGQRL